MTSEELREEVKNALDKIRPYLQNDGGDITLVDIEDDKIVKVRLEGTCTNCAVNQMTLKSGVEMTIKEGLAEEKEGIFIPHDEVMREAKRIINQWEQKMLN